MRKVLYIILSFLALQTGAIHAAAPSPTFTPTPGGLYTILNHMIVHGNVTAMTATAGGVFLGGNLYVIAPRTGMGMPVDPATGAVLNGFPEIDDGEVRAAISDGAGGWYVGGSFTYIAGQARNRIAHIYSNGSLDPVFKPNITSGTVYSLAFDGTSVYIGGSFFTIESQTRNEIAKVNGVTGAVDAAFNPGTDAVVNSVIYNGGYIYLGGGFSTVAGQPRLRAAKVNAATGALDASFNPSPGGGLVTVMLHDGTSVYIGGEFYTVNGTPRNCIAKVDALTGALDPVFNPNPDVYVYSMAYDGTNLYFGGSFASVGGVACPKIAKVNAATGALDASFNHGVYQFAWVYSLEYSGGYLYAGGDIDTYAGKPVMNAVKINASTGLSEDAFVCNPYSTVHALSYNTTGLFVAGGSMGGQRWGGLAKINPDTGILDASFNPGITGTAAVFAVAGPDMYVGGAFTNIGGQAINSLAKINMTTGIVDASFNANIASGGGVNEIYYDGTNLFIAGSFGSVGGQIRKGIAKVNALTGALDPLFYAYVLNTSYVYALASDGPHIFLGGTFTNVNGVDRNYLAKVDSVTGSLDPDFVPDPNSDISKLKYANGVLYAAGAFTQIGGLAGRNYLAKLDGSTGAVDALFNPSIGSYVSASDLALDGVNAYFSGSFYTVGGLTRNNLAKVSQTGGTVDALFNPAFSDSQYKLALSPANDVLYVAGNFTTASKLPVCGYAAIYVGAPPVPTITRTSTTGPSPTQSGTRTFTITRTHTVSPTITITRTNTPVFTQTATRTISQTMTNSPVFTPTVTPTDYSIILPTKTPGNPALFSLVNNVITDGTVSSVLAESNDVFIGGTFTRVGIKTGNGLLINALTGEITADYADVVGDINTVVSDGAGGWYVGGSFDYVNGASAPHLAHIFADGSLDTAFLPNVGNAVSYAVLNGGSLYIYGSFSTVGGQPVGNIAKISASTGAIDTAFQPNILGTPINALIVDNGYLYVGGGFGLAGGQAIRCLARLDPLTGAPDTSFNLNLASGDYVNGFLQGPGCIYVRGQFANIGGLPRTGLAKIISSSGVLDPAFNPVIGFGTVTSFDYSTGNLYIGGNFSSVGGQIHTRLAKVDGITGAVDPAFNPSSTDYVRAIACVGSQLYLGTVPGYINGTLRRGLAKIDTATGALDPVYDPMPYGTVNTIARFGTSLYAGGSFQGIKWQARDNFAKITASTGYLDQSFNVSVNGRVRSMAYDGAGLYIGGLFTAVGSFPRNNLAKLDAASGAVDNNFTPDVNNEVMSVKYGGADIFAGGYFTAVNGQARNYLAKIASANGVLEPGFDSYLPNSSAVNSVLIKGPDLYITGTFNGIYGTPVKNVAKLSAASGLPDPVFYCNVNGTVYTAESDGPGLYLGGQFITVNGVNKSNFARIDAVTGSLDLNPRILDLSYDVESILSDGNNRYLCGDFISMGTYLKTGLGRFSLPGGDVDPAFTANTDIFGTAAALAFSPAHDILYVGGGFWTINNRTSNNFAAIYLGIQGTPTPSPSITVTHTISPTFTFTLTASSTSSKTATSTPTVSATITQTHTVSPTFTISETYTVSPTVTETHSITMTHTISATSTATFTLTATPTSTVTQSLTQTLTRTPADTATQTRSATATASVTAAITPTPTVIMGPANQPVQVLIFPNPSVTGDIKISILDCMGAQTAEFSVFSRGYRLVRKFSFSTSSAQVFTLENMGLANGIYIIRTRLLKDGEQIYRGISLAVIIK